MVKNSNWAKLAKYLSNLDGKYTNNDVYDILNAIGLPKTFLVDFYSGGYSTKQK